MERLKQLFFKENLEIGQVVDLPKELSRRLSKVLRFKKDDHFALFNGIGGLYKVLILDESCRTIEVLSLMKEREGVVENTLIIALTKKEAMNHVFRQSVEMGVTHIQPVTTDYTVPSKLNTERVEALLIEASEQCERLDVPELLNVKPLKDVINDYDSTVFWCAEHVRGKWGNVAPKSGDAMLVGPEGGFSNSERDYLNTHTNVTPVGLGSLILRVDTAVVAALSRFFDRV